eukprot:CAMPEP_0198250326 /NCGR_PEP_ID=MMETSP1447-20131203/1558_1 /TAXON_ID=420782 /ORGANISM="Chaetoceros dichaeta, Strain CCMP1751" /LENGTH=434 /DNA_ID=CAMNT_0043935139 /DNA_START=122 /DNA_END=1426 /DNA_ORIENTATION=+
MTTFVDKTAPALESLNQLSAAHPDLEPLYSKFSSQLSRKLYHQLTLSIYAFVSDQDEQTNAAQNLRQNESNNNFYALYSQVLTCVENRVNPLTLSRIANCVANSLLLVAGDTSRSDSRAVLDDLLVNLQLDKNLEMDGNLPARLYTESKLHLLTLNLAEGTVAMEDTTPTTEDDLFASTKKFLKEKESILAELANGTESDVAIVHSAYYECAMTYRKAIGPPEAYYTQAIQYLHYTPLDSISHESKLKIATDLSLAALTGDGVYNFGEVVHNNEAILGTLQGTDNEWLVKLMYASANGNVSELDAISTTYATAIAAQPALVNRGNVVKEKIALLALVNMVFERDSHDRTLKFEDIATRIQMPTDQVELFIMRALSLGLIKGSMDQVDGTVDVTWVMPRVLDKVQMGALAGRFGEWAVKVSKTSDYMGERVPTFG